MSNFYVNSVKRKMKFQKLDLQNLQNDDNDKAIDNQMSPKDEIRQEENNLRDEAISNLKLKLHNNFSHILGNQKQNSIDTAKSVSIENLNEYDSNDLGFLNEAKSSLEQIEDLAGFKVSKSDQPGNDLEETSPDKLLNFISSASLLYLLPLQSSHGTVTSGRNCIWISLYPAPSQLSHLPPLTLKENLPAL